MIAGFALLLTIVGLVCGIMLIVVGFQWWPALLWPIGMIAFVSRPWWWHRERYTKTQLPTVSRHVVRPPIRQPHVPSATSLDDPEWLD